MWKGTDFVGGVSAHGKQGIVKGNYVEIEGLRRTYSDSGACFMMEE